MRPDLSLIALTGTPSQVTGVKAASARFALGAGQALGIALSDLYGVTVPDGIASSTKAAQAPHIWLDIPASSPVALVEPARARKVFVPSGDRLVPAYFMEFFSHDQPGTSSDAFSYLIAADDGRVLDRHDLTADVAFRYRVFADADAEGRPADGPTADYTPHPTGVPDNSDPAFVPSVIVTAESFKSEPAGAVDPWLPANAVQTLGNNVDAYADLFTPDGYSNRDLRAVANTNRPNTFDYRYLATQEPGQAGRQKMAATTNLFYTINWLHDYFYDSGFTEAAGNAQTNNFGRGGAQSDSMRAEAQDFGGLNNANMSTPSDGLRPRMQMFLWGAPSIRALAVQGGPELAPGFANFGPPNFDLTAQVVLVDDGVDQRSDGCQPIVNDVSGRIALVDRNTTCNFVVRALNAQAAGAVGMVVANNLAGPAPTLANTNPPTTVAIPALSLSITDGATLKALVQNGPVNARIFRQLTGPGRDGSIDNMIIAHEWGHYFHHRLSDCGSFQCGAMSEGWGDFVALHMSLREGDDLDGTYGMSIYGPRLLGDSGYFGIRRFPYSVDFTKNALSFRHIQNGVTLPSVPMKPNASVNSEVHNAGEVWTSMLFEAYVALQKNPAGRTFGQVRRAFADYMVLGLLMAPVDATFTEMRDSILAAALVLEPDDVAVLAGGFALRGAGSCAVSPPRSINGDLAPVTESFDVRASIVVTSIEISDQVDSCDLDGTLDAGETGQVKVEVANKSPIPMSGTTVTLSTDTAGVTFPAGATANLPDIGAFGSATATLEIALDESITDVGLLELDVTVQNDEACIASVSQVRFERIHADEVPEAANVEDVEARTPPWSKTGAGAAALWERAELAGGNHAWHGVETGNSTDVQLVTPAIQVSATGDLQISFEHAFSFEVANNSFFDGGVIEISADNGLTWQDVSTIVEPGYTQVLAAGNPLAGRRAYAGQSPGFPATVPVSLDLGSALAGQTILLRFRLVTDVGGGGPGWTIDDIAFQGIDNTPFTAILPHEAVCQEPPNASAGADRTVKSGADVILNASGSSDPNGDSLTYLWTQTAGTGVALFDANTANAVFKAPVVESDEVLSFRVQVSDQQGASTDDVDITVRAEEDAGEEDPGSGGPDPGEGGGEDSGEGGGGGDDERDEGSGRIDDGGCRLGGDASLPFAFGLLLAVGALSRRRRLS
jgi:hypothetical protein